MRAERATLGHAPLWPILSGGARGGILADRWTVLIIRELLADISHFNELERGLPHISRTLLAERLRRLGKQAWWNDVSLRAGNAPSIA